MHPVKDSVMEAFRATSRKSCTPPMYILRGRESWVKAPGDIPSTLCCSSTSKIPSRPVLEIKAVCQTPTAKGSSLLLIESKEFLYYYCT